MNRNIHEKLLQILFATSYLYTMYIHMYWYIHIFMCKIHKNTGCFPVFIFKHIRTEYRESSTIYHIY